MQQRYAPGMRVEIRDVRRVMRGDYRSDGGYELACAGLSVMMQGRAARALTDIDEVRILDDRETALVNNINASFDTSHLYIDSRLRKPALSDGSIHLGHCAAIDEIAFQLEPALQARGQSHQRADTVGLAKPSGAWGLHPHLRAIARKNGRSAPNTIGQFACRRSLMNTFRHSPRAGGLSR